VTLVSEITGFPEILGGRVKTLHPMIHGGLLFKRGDESHLEEAARHGIRPIDLVYIDLYPFEEACAQATSGEEQIVEMIDIGGPAMLRSAAKNHAHVLVALGPSDLPQVAEELQAHGGASRAAFRRQQAARTFQRTAAYDAAIARHFTKDTFPERLVLGLERKQVTRYGENPHQAGAVYSFPAAEESCLTRAKLVSGEKALSYNNYLDASAALELVSTFGYPAAVVVKHRNPCGAAQHHSSLLEAFLLAYAGDPPSAFGGILAFNRPVDRELARTIADPARFIEVIIAPAFEGEAAGLLRDGAKWGKNCRLLEVPVRGSQRPAANTLEYRSISGGLLVQEGDQVFDAEFHPATKRSPTAEELEDLRFAWEICRHVVSNGIALVKGSQLVGTGAGQASRVDSVRIAVRKAGARARGAVLASDAFFPFPDGIEVAHEAGVTAVIQPGGSRRDQQVIQACEEYGMAMLFTGRRHFRH